MNLSGVYQIVCVPTGKKYIGSAINFHNRKALHWHQLTNGVHHSRHLQRAWDKYGADAFSFVPVLECAGLDLIRYEQKLLDALLPEFNMAPTAGSTLGLKHSGAAKRANSARCKLQRSSPEWRAAQSERIKRASSEGKLDAVVTGLRKWIAAQPHEVLAAKYTPEVRCKLAEKARARAKTHLVLGEEHTVLSAAIKFGVSRGLLKNRLRRGWTLENAVFVPIATRHRKK